MDLVAAYNKIPESAMKSFKYKLFAGPFKVRYEMNWKFAIYILNNHETFPASINAQKYLEIENNS